jgi:hypothetical protein
MYGFSEEVSNGWTCCVEGTRIQRNAIVRTKRTESINQDVWYYLYEPVMRFDDIIASLFLLLEDFLKIL